ncbi:SusC/RagA family TonB-linked outer membrane protein [Aquimarina litoralis]|uniref:SusC/RagA family TonB-linked outer membrane protein n=1 Tax=Aquimarina litoralis TaxID=584605 RepID=UPI001C5888B7|nr:TonB-dependent receptor [Aquimarina litoralis]MBW1294453.1 SusC/RagA family TonB-linked outer membrane protein [Aquimarina litoralis]
MKNNLLRILFIGIFMMVSNTYSQSVSGTVTGEDGIPVPGVNVIVKGTTNGTSTDFDGKYAVTNVTQDAILVFSFLGFQTQEIQVLGQEVINVSLKSDAEALDQVVVLAYGQVQNKKSVTTSIATIDPDVIKQLPISQAEAALQGTVPGVVVQQNSGSPGSPQTVRVRGVGTPNGSAPLYIVDGVQVPNLTFLNPNDIKSQTVLKDAASSAIYGSRGGNGVILVETLRGKRASSKPQVTINGYYGIQSLANKPDLMNRDEYVEYYNAGVTAAGANLATGFRGAFSDAERALLPDTDWYDVLFDDAPIQDIYASVVGGSEKIKYSVSGGYFGQEGILGGDDKAEFNRRNIRGTLSGDITENIDFSLVAQFQNQERFNVVQNNGGAGVGLSSFINALPPIYPAFDEQGNFFNPGLQNSSPTVNGVPLNSLGAVQNPLFSLALLDSQTDQDVLNLSASLGWEPIDNLKIKGSYGIYSNAIFNRSFQPLIQQLDQEYDTTTGVFYQEVLNKTRNRQYGGTVEYFFGKLAETSDHNLNILGGYEVVETRFDGGAVVRDPGQFLVNDFDSVNFSLSEDSTDAIITPGISSAIGLESYFGKLDYDYNQRYLFSAVIRNDKSSNFGPNKRSGWFPAVSAGWVISEENFLVDSEIINLLKVRGSWGISGNDGSPRALAYLSSVNTQVSYAGQQGIVLTGLANPDLKWEEITQFNVGLDINAFRDRLGFTVDYYTKKTSDILLQATTPLTSGLQPSVENTGDIENRGFEFILSWRDNYESGFSWNASVNLGLNKNEVTSLGETSFIDSAPIQPQFQGFASRTRVGDPIASFFGFVVEGVDANGNLLFADLDNSGNNQLTPDAGDRTIIGDPNPDATFGFNFGFEYKGFDFSTFMSGTAGNDIFDATIRYDAVGTNRPSSYLAADAPRNVAATTSTNGEQLISDFHVKDGTYLKLKNVTIGYTLPEVASSSIGAESIRIYVSGQNLFFLTEYDGLDPEIGQNNLGTPLNIGIDQGFFPQSRNFLMGFNFNF